MKQKLGVKFQEVSRKGDTAQVFLKYFDENDREITRKRETRHVRWDPTRKAWIDAERVYYVMPPPDTHLEPTKISDCGRVPRAHEVRSGEVRPVLLRELPGKVFYVEMEDGSRLRLVHEGGTRYRDRSNQLYTIPKFADKSQQIAV